jgi:uncharacterized surface protein with fasciclin (FAS1) repeats
MRPVALLLLAAVVSAGTAGADGVMPPPRHRETAPAVQGDVIATLRARGQYGVFLRLVEASGLAGRLRTASVTVFAPADPVFEALPPGTVERLLAPDQAERLKQIVLTHLVAGTLTRDQLLSRAGPLASEVGTALPVSARDGRLRVGEAFVNEADIPATNGTIFAVDRLLQPNS